MGGREARILTSPVQSPATRLAAVRELCGVLAFYGGRLDRLRHHVDPGDSAVNGSTYLVPGAAYGDVSPWYRVIEPVFAELDGYVRGAGAAFCESVFADGRIRTAAPLLHQLRACYEFDTEYDQARALLMDRDPGAALAALLEEQAHWTRAPRVAEALAGCKRLAVLGSGPLPLTALAFAAALSDDNGAAEVTCIERDPEAIGIARKLIAVSARADAIETVEASVDHDTDLTGFDALIGTVLLGVSLEDDGHAAKAELIRSLMDRASPDAVLVLRDPYRMGRLFYPPAGLEGAAGLEVTRHDPETGPDIPYSSSYLVVRQAGGAAGHA